MFKEIPLDQRKENRGVKRSKVYGRGVNDAPYQTTLEIAGQTFTCPYFARWTNMFMRCYSKHWLKKHPTYQGTEVCQEWYSFMAFRSWMEKQDWQGKHLDKDLLSLGKKVYSPETCLFVTPHINSLFIQKENSTNTLPPGVYFRKGKYEVGVSLGENKRVWIGAYNTVPEAIDAYISAKKQAVKKALDTCQDNKIRAAVKKYAEVFYDKLIKLKAGY